MKSPLTIALSVLLVLLSGCIATPLTMRKETETVARRHIVQSYDVRGCNILDALRQLKEEALKAKPPLTVDCTAVDAAVAQWRLYDFSDAALKVTFCARNAALRDLLDPICGPAGLSYRFERDRIVITPNWKKKGEQGHSVYPR